MQPNKVSKSERTEERLLSIAFQLFLEVGYEKTTMRAIAERAKLSPGAAYYYIDSKEHLIHYFYQKTQEEHSAATREVLATEKTFRARLEKVLKKKIEMSEPYHELFRVLFKTAADPKSPLSPFGPETETVRREATAIYREVLEGSTTKFSDDLKERLPEYLWLYQMGVILYWLYDFSPQHEKTFKFIEKTVDLIIKLLSVANLPPMRPVRRAVFKLLDEFRLKRTQTQEPVSPNHTSEV